MDFEQDERETTTEMRPLESPPPEDALSEVEEKSEASEVEEPLKEEVSCVFSMDFHRFSSLSSPVSSHFGQSSGLFQPVFNGLLVDLGQEKLDDAEFEALEKGEVASSAGKSSGFGEAVGMLTLRQALKGVDVT